MKKLGIIICMACAGLYGCRNSDATGQKTVELSGSGATFPAPYYNLVFKTFEQQTANQVSYGGVGSGGGIRSLKDGIVDFAGSDAFLSDEEMKNMPSVIHIPTCLGAVVLAYHLQGITSLTPLLGVASSLCRVKSKDLALQIKKTVEMDAPHRYKEGRNVAFPAASYGYLSFSIAVGRMLTDSLRKMLLSIIDGMYLHFLRQFLFINSSNAYIFAYQSACNVCHSRRLPNG